MTRLFDGRLNRRRMMVAAGAVLVGSALPRTGARAEPSLKVLTKVATIGPEPDSSSNFRLALSPDGKAMLTISRIDVATLWDLTTGKLVRSFSLKDMSDICFAGNDRAIISTSDKQLSVWDLATGRMISAFKSEGADIEAVAASPDGRFTVVGQDRMLSLWDLTTGARAGLREDKDQGSISRLVFSPDGKGLACEYIGSLRVYEMPSLELVAAWELSLSVGGVAFSPDGRLIIVGEDERIRVFDVVDKRQVARIDQLGPERSFFQAMAALPNGLVTVDDHGNVLVGSLATSAFIAKGDDPPPKAETVAVSPDRSRAYVGNGYGEILVYDVSGLT